MSQPNFQERAKKLCTVLHLTKSCPFCSNIAQAIQSEVEAEREACAKVAEGEIMDDSIVVRSKLAQAIRKRSKGEGSK